MSVYSQSCTLLSCHGGNWKPFCDSLLDIQVANPLLDVVRAK